MNHHRPRFTVAALAAAAFCSAMALLASPASALTIGDAAPPLKVGKWIKGEPVASFEPGKIYVVEFWATWCGPCRQTIPHLTQLQQQHKDVTFIGTDVWEREEGLAEPFVQQMGDQMNYRVATDDKIGEEGSMAQTWMQAANRDSIPTAFIVNKEGKVAWIGHPMTMEEPLGQIIAGNYDMAAAKTKADAEQAEAAAMQQVQQELQQKVGPALQAQDFNGVAKAMDEIIAAHPAAKKQLLWGKFVLLAQGNVTDQAYAAADQLAGENDAQMLNQLAWTIATNPRIQQKDFDRALRYATKANELTHEQNPDVMDTLARVYAEKNDLAKAVEWETKAVAAAGDSSPQAAALKQNLDQYKNRQQNPTTAPTTAPAH